MTTEPTGRVIRQDATRRCARSALRLLVAGLLLPAFGASCDTDADAGDTPAISPIRSFEEEARDLLSSHPPLADWIRQDTGLSWETFLGTRSALSRPVLETMFAEIGARGGDASRLRFALDRLPTDDPETRLLLLYSEVAEQRRELRLGRSIGTSGVIAFAQHHNFVSSFFGYTEGLSDARHERSFRPDTRLSLLVFDGSVYGEKRDLITDPNGVIRDVDVSQDGARLLFSWKTSDREDDYHIYEYDLRDDSTRQLTFGLGSADTEPQYLPDGDIVFASTRSEHSVPCWWTEVSNLYRMDGDGQYMRRLAVDQVHTLYPTVLESGRVIYTRWDYNDRGQVYPHPLFSMNPDGTAQRVYYGGNSWFPNSLLHARGVPGTSKVLAIASGHHTLQRGQLVEIDVTTGRDEGDGLSFVAPPRSVPYERKDKAMQEGAIYKYPYPLNESEFLVTYTPDEAPALFIFDLAVYGLYWMDREGHRELLYQPDEIPVGRAVALGKSRTPAVLEPVVDYRSKTATLYVHDVYDGVGLTGVPRGEAKKIRVVELDYRAAGVGSTPNGADEPEGGGSLNSTPVAVGNASWDVKRILGDVDVEDDGSARFEVPAMASIYLQILDDKGRVIQTTRSWDTLMPGEQKACRGCHVKEDANFHAYEPDGTLAWTRPPQRLQPFYGESRGFSFIQEIQPILDAKCVGCHDGQAPEVISLRGELVDRGTVDKRRWSDAYLNLTHATAVPDQGRTAYVGDHRHPMVNWISKMSPPTELPPYFAGSATSALLDLLDSGEHHGVTLDEEEYQKLAAWMDLLVPFVGDFREANAWSQAEVDFYDYYLEKRRVQRQLETANIEALLLSEGAP